MTFRRFFNTVVVLFFDLRNFIHDLKRRFDSMWYLQQHVFLSFSDAGRTKKGFSLSKVLCTIILQNVLNNQIKQYLDSISYDVNVMHEFTDGCLSQYKSRHCLGDLSWDMTKKCSVIIFGKSSVQSKRHILKSHVCVLLLHVSYTLYAENNLIVFHSFQHSGSLIFRFAKFHTRFED
jgi:hypothetical protein